MSSKPRTRRVVVITGASSGIGQATALAFAAEGAILFLASRNLEAEEAVARECNRLGGEAHALRADIGEAAEIRALAETAVSRAGRIDVWVSNAGVGAVGRFHETPIEAHEQVVRTNLIGHMNDAHAVLPVFLRQRQGVFININSLGAFAATPFAASYSASKYGLRGFSEALRAELRDQPGIHVCDIYPAFVDTPGIAHGANHVGRRLTAPPPLLDPRTVARRIVKVSRHPRPTTMIGVVTPVLRLAHALAPEATVGTIGRVMKTYFSRAPRVPRSEGNVHTPPATPGGIDGGLRQDSSLATRGAVAAGCVLGVLLARRLIRG